MPKHAHMSLNDRVIIQSGLENGASRSSIAKTLGKDRSTIVKEIKKRRFIVKPRATFVNGLRPVFDCIHMSDCGCKNVCRIPCEKYEMMPCVRRDRKVGVCNGCEKKRSCKKIQYHYDAKKADDEYINDLHDSREGINLTTSQAKEIGDIIKPLIDKGQSVYAILHNHPEIDICEKTLYNYITDGVFSQNGLIDLDLRLKTSRKKPKAKIYSRPRESRAYLKGRTHDCYLDYMAKHPNDLVVEMDTVYNDETNGPFIQTFEFVDYDIMIAFYHDRKTAEAMTSGVYLLKEWLGDSFKDFVQVLLTDRGSEFVNAEEIEALGCPIFYCDAMCSSQKPNVENNHVMLRWVLPKKADLKEIGLRSQADLNLIFSHINSYPRKELRGKSAIDLLLFYHDEPDILDKFHLKKIEKDDVILKPKLIKKN